MNRSARGNEDDPRLAKAFSGRVLHQRDQLFQRPPHRAVPCDGKEPLHADMCD